MAKLVVGTPAQLRGDITTLQWIKPGYEFETESALGYHHGRLAQGYWVSVMTQKPGDSDFEFAGTTLRSGGRLGLPHPDPEIDAARTLVREEMIAKYGMVEYHQMRKAFLANAMISGSQRLAKVTPVIPHNDQMPADQQYPAGGGGLQWTLTKEVPFYVVLFVAPDGMVTAPDYTVNLRREGYEARARLRQTLMTAPATTAQNRARY
jgi:hypothetical protein